MKNTNRLISVAGLCLFLLPAPTMAQHTIWLSPLTLTTANTNVTVRPFTPQTAVRVTSVAVGPFQWVDLGLPLPSNVVIDSVTVCYQLRDPASFITQVRLTKMTTPDVAVIQHDDPTDLTEPTATCYMSPVGGLAVDGVMTLSLQLDFASTSDWIQIGAISVAVSPAP